MCHIIIEYVNKLEMEIIQYVIATPFVLQIKETTKKVYDSSFGEAYQTNKNAIKTDSGVKLQDVTAYMSNRDDIQVKTQPETFNNLFPCKI